MKDNKKEKNEKSMEELPDEALDDVAGGKSVIFWDCAVCRGSASKLGPDGNYYCSYDYKIKFPDE